MNAGAGTLTVSGPVTIGANNELVALANTQSTVISGAIGNNGSTASALTYGGASAGTLTLSAANTYTGGTLIESGTLQLGNGTTTGTLSTTGAITDNGTLAFNRTNAVTQGTDFTAAAITGNGSLTQAGSGTLTLNALNSYTGGTTVNAGTLSLNAGGTIGAVRGVVTVNPGAALTLAATDALGYTSTALAVTTINVNGGTVNNTTAGNEGFLTSFNLTGGTVSSTGGGVYQIAAGDPSAPGVTTNASATTSVFSGSLNVRSGNLTYNVAQGTTATGTDLLVSGAVTGAGGVYGIIKTGSGTMMLSMANTYTGATTVNGGSLFVTGSTAAASAVTVNNSGTLLGGTGTIGGTVKVGNGAIISAGNLATSTTPIGTLTTGALTLQTGSIFNALLSSNTSFSTLNASGTTALGNAAFTIGLTPGATFTPTAPGAPLELITSPVTGTFTDSVFAAGGYTFTADYSNGEFGVDISAVPEPSTWICGCLTVGVAAVSRRRQIAGWLRSVCG